MKSYERICKCGCGSIINLKEHNYTVVKNYSRNSYYEKGHYLNSEIKRIAEKFSMDFNNEDNVKWLKERIEKDVNVEDINNY